MVLPAGLLLLGTWFLVHFDRLFAGDDDSLIRLVLGGLFSLLIVLRRKPQATPPRSRGLIPAAAVTGALAAVIGIVAQIHMFEWIGVLLLLLACLLWVLPPRAWRDALLAMVVLFWVHPLPGQVFGWLQMSMQVMTVQVSEWALQVAAVRVWADGIMLRTGFQNFMVPEVCSGMRAAVTVFLSTLGLCLLLRIRWYQTILFVLLGLAQVLLLNVARVSYMVIWAPRMDPEWADNFLHDSLGTFLLIAVVAIQVEVSAWKRWSDRRRERREGIAKGELEHPERASIIPHALRSLIRYGLIALVFLVAIGVVAGVAYRSRPQHRAEMVREVIEELIDASPEAAGRALREMLERYPQDRDFRGKQVRVDLQLGEFETALARLDILEAEAPLSLNQSVLKAWALMQTGRRALARQIVTGLPPHTASFPGVAMLRAELAAFDGDPAAVAEAVVLAARSRLMMPRVRSLFPFLAGHELWNTIVQADRELPYTRIESALISVHAGLRSGNVQWAANALTRALAAWPQDPRFLASAFELARVWRGADWADRFGELLRLVLPDLGPDLLAQNIDRAFELGRPSLAWMILLRLRQSDPTDPALTFALARYAPVWFDFRKRALGIAAQMPGERTDIRPFVEQTRLLAPFQRIWDRALAVDSGILDVPYDDLRASAIAACLAELAKRDAAGALTRRMDILYPMALALAGELDAAHARLDIAGARFPDLLSQAEFQHAVLYDQAGEWDRAYEALRRSEQAGGGRSQMGDMIRINALMNHNLAIGVLEVLREARVRFPESLQPDMIEASVWNAFGYWEEALFVIERAGARRDTEIMMRLLRDTGRLQEARRLARSLGIPFDASGLSADNYRLHPAEWTILPRWPGPPNEEERAEMLAILEQRETAASPFLDGLNSLQQRWLREGPVAELLRIETWLEPARTPIEQIGALHAFAMHAMRHGYTGEAEAAVRMALRHAPRSAPLWRLLTVMTRGDPEVIAEARRQCPDDSELWLASLVIQTAEGAQLPERVKQSIDAMLSGRSAAPGQLVRAGDFLLRNGHSEAAYAIGRAVIPRARGMLAAHILGIRSGLAQGDLDWAQTCTLSGIEQALDPGPFYRVLVNLKAASGRMDNELVQALEYLNEQERDQAGWGDLLGRVYFFQGNMRRAARLFDSVTAESGALRPGTVVLAAESARLQERPDRSRRLLEAAYARNPDDRNLLNNLIYILAQDERTLGRAVELLPALIERADNHPGILDTIATVYMRSGRLTDAQRYYELALRHLPDDTYGALEIRLNAAELELRAGRYAAARERLQQIRRKTGGNELLDVRTRRLLQELDTLHPAR